MKPKKEKTGVWKHYFSMLFESGLPIGLIITSFAFAMIETLATYGFDENVGSIFPENPGDYASMTKEFMITACTICLVYGLLKTLAKIATYYLNGLISAKVNRNIQKYAAGRVFRLKTKTLEETDARELITRLTEDTVKSSDFTVELFVNEVPRIALAVLILVRITKFGIPVLFWSQLLQIPIIFALTLLAGYLAFKNRNKVQKKLAEVTARIAEKIDNLETIKSFNNEELEIKLGNELLDEYDRVKKEMARVDKINDFIKCMAWIIPLFIMVIPPAICKQQGLLSIPDFVRFFALAMSYNTALADQIPAWLRLKEAQGATLRLSSVISTELESEASGSSDIVCGDIEFKNVSLVYGDNKALDNVSFTVEKGKKTALVGLSGSGKSSALNLIEKFYEPAEGSITLGGVDIADYDYTAYRSVFAYLPQNAPGFGGTVRAMLEYSSEEKHSDDELNAALEKAGVLDDITALGGLDYEIGYNGEKLSGGQRQKLGIARLLLSKAEYILLDEATSALDIESVKSVSAEIDKFSEGKTLILVTHDMDTVKNADKILVLCDGKLIAQGTDAELRTTCDLYKKLAKEGM